MSFGETYSPTTYHGIAPDIDIWKMSMDYAIWVYNRIPDMKYGLSATEIWSKLIFEPVQKPLSTVMFGVVQHIFWDQSCRSIEFIFLSRLPGVE